MFIPLWKVAKAIFSRPEALFTVFLSIFSPFCVCVSPCFFHVFFSFGATDVTDLAPRQLCHSAVCQYAPCDGARIFNYVLKGGYRYLAGPYRHKQSNMDKLG